MHSRAETETGSWRRAPASSSLAALILIVLAVGYFAAYLRAATLDVAYADYLLPPFITSVEACLDGRGCLDALLAPTSNGYRWTVPAFLLYLNAEYFGLTARFDQALGVAGLALAAWTLFWWLRGSWLTPAQRPSAVLLFTPCLLLLFNLNQWENLVLGIGGYHLIGIAALIICLRVIDRVLRAPRMTAPDAIMVLATVALSSLFLLQYFVVLIATLIGLTVIARAGRGPTALAVLLMVVAGSGAGLLLTFVPSGALGGSMGAAISAASLPVFGRFLLNMYSAALLQWEGKQSLVSHGLWLGLPMVAAVSTATWLFLRQKQYRSSLLPLGLLFYSVAASVVIAVARLGYGADYGFASRYTTQTALGLLGCYLILIRAIPERRRNRAATIGLAAFAVLAVAMHLLTHQVQWKIAPHRQAYYREVVRVAGEIERATDEDLARFQIPPELTRKALVILQRHRLAYYRPHRSPPQPGR